MYPVIFDFGLVDIFGFQFRLAIYSFGLMLVVAFYTCYFLLNYDLILFTYLILIFLLGFISDKKIINSAKLRFFLQFILIVGFVYQIDLNIDSTKLDYLDNLLTNQFFSYFFSLFGN